MPKVQKLTRSGHTEWDCIGTLHVEMLIRTKVRRGGVKIDSQNSQSNRINRAIRDILRNLERLDWRLMEKNAGRFLKVLGNKFTLKSSPKGLFNFGLFIKRSINVKSGLDIIWATFLSLASGHTACNSCRFSSLKQISRVAPTD